MWTLIDGYNLMHASGVMEGKFTPDRFRKVRLRFLNTVASKLPAAESRLTTVVFDAKHPPEHLATEEHHKGITVVYAARDDDADSRIEELIAHHPQPRKLRVISSDRRIRDAARRRKAQSLSSEEFLDLLDRAATRVRIGQVAASSAPSSPQLPPPPAERDHWLRAFGHLDEEPDLVGLRPPTDAILSDADLARIAREVAQEATPTRRPR